MTHIDRTLVITPHRCTGCRTCELSCAMAKKKETQLARPRIHIHSVSQGAFIQMTCLQCVEAACVVSCPTGALVRNPATSAIDNVDERCIGCGLCQVACPFGHMFFNSRSGKVEKCDLCSGDPACARFCPSKALEYK